MVPDSDFLKRLNVCRLAGRRVATAFSLLVTRRYGREVVIRFDENHSHLEKIVRDYFGRVATFKDAHDFERGDLVNAAKRAALTTLTLADREWDCLFVMPENVRQSVFGGLLGPYWAYMIICALLGIDMETIDSKVEHDLMYCLTTRRKADPEWLSWAMHVFQRDCLRASRITS